MKSAAKVCVWIGVIIFLLLTVFALMAPVAASLTFWWLVLGGVSVLGLGIAGMATFFLRRGTLKPEEHRLPKKYLILLIPLLALLGLGLLLT